MLRLALFTMALLCGVVVVTAFTVSNNDLVQVEALPADPGPVHIDYDELAARGIDADRIKATAEIELQQLRLWNEENHSDQVSQIYNRGTQ